MGQACFAQTPTRKKRSGVSEWEWRRAYLFLCLLVCPINAMCDINHMYSRLCEPLLLSAAHAMKTFGRSPDLEFFSCFQSPSS